MIVNFSVKLPPGFEGKMLRIDIFDLKTGEKIISHPFQAGMYIPWNFPEDKGFDNWKRNHLI